MRRELAKKETEFLRQRRIRLTGRSFESLKIIGRGAFGEVPLAFSILVSCHLVFGRCHRGRSRRYIALFCIIFVWLPEDDVGSVIYLLFRFALYSSRVLVRYTR